MSGIEVVINGLPQNLANSLMQSLVILSSGLDQNTSTTLNNIDIQNIGDGGNIKIGEAAMSNAVNAPQTNIAIGYQSLLVVDGSTLDSDNIAIGKQALYNVTTGGKNIGIGANALNGLITQTNTIGIGNNTQSTASNGIIIGNNAVLTTNNSGMLKFNSTTSNTSYPAANEFWFGDPLTGWVDIKAGDVYVDTLDVSGALTTGSLSLNSLQVISDTGSIDVIVRNSDYTNNLNKIDEIRNTSSFRNKYGPIAFIADVSGISASATDPILRDKILFGYQQGTKAIEINTYGAISLDSVNSGSALPALTSNYGISGQVIMSQGSTNNAKWMNVTDASGVINLNNRNIMGITYVRDASGNLDSSSNFIYDGSGIGIVSSKNAQLFGLTIQNTNTGTAATTDLKLKNSTNTAMMELKSTGYTAGTTIDALSHMLSISNPSGSLSIMSGDKILLGYSSSNKAIEISSSGAMSFDTSNNTGAWVSNYGTSGQILSSQGSSAPPKWITNTGGITMSNANINGIGYVKDASGNLDSSSNFIYDGSGIQITSNKNSKLYGLQLQNTSTGTAATTDLTLKNSTNTAMMELKSTGYPSGTTIDALSNILSLSNPSGSLSIMSGDRTLIGYSSNNKAIEIASSGAMSFDTSNNSGSWVSNYGTSGQILSSQGSSAPPKWITNSGGGITMANANINGIPFIKDTSGNLDSSSNFIYDGSGLTLLTEKTGNLNILTLGNTITGDGTAQTNIKIKNGSSGNCFINYKSPAFNNVNNTIADSRNNFSFQNEAGDIALIPSGIKKLLLGYNSGLKAVEINQNGAMSFDTSGNNDNPLTFTSNYGTSGQVLISQGSSAPPQWTTPSFSGFPKIISIVKSNYSTTIVDSSANLYSANLTGLTSGKTRIITFTTGVHTSTIGTGYYEYSLSITGTASQIYNVKKPNTNLAQQHTITFTYSNTNTIETIVIKLNTIDGALNISNYDYYSFRMEEIQ
jgi:hypothetical protein